MPRNHETMRNLEKPELLKYYKRIQENGDRASLLGLADWAKEKFQLQKLPNKQAILKIIHNEPKIQEENNNNYNYQWRKIAWSDFLNLKKYWLNGCEKCMTKIYVLPMDYLKEMLKEKVELNFSNRYLYKFKKRN